MKLIIIVIAFFFLLLIAGCNNQINGNVITDLQSCPASCNDFNQCTRDICNENTSFKCQYIPIENCCGNLQCEPNESYSTCSSDCRITEEECLQEVEGYFSFKFISQKEVVKLFT